MLKHEIKKLFVKRHGLLLMLAMVIAEFVVMNCIYTPKHFDNEITKVAYYDYMSYLSGTLTTEKENFLYSEQEKVYAAKSKEQDLINRIISGELDDEEEYLLGISEIQPLLDKAQALELTFEKYNYVSEAADKRYFIVGEYNGLCRDYPDVLFVAFVVFLTALSFLGEESSQMITLIRAYPKGKSSTLYAKIGALGVFFLIAQILASGCEFLFLCREGGLEALSYPIQSISYFSGCFYNISIAECFVSLQITRLLGYIFLAAIVILLCVTIKKPLFVVFVPCSLCLLQQFLFTEESTAYYLPTGFLRATGYFRGEVYETLSEGTNNQITTKTFSEIPISVFGALVVLISAFCAAAVFAARSYYDKKPQKSKHIRALSLLMLMIFNISGCNSQIPTDICYNLKDGFYMLQNDTQYFVKSSDGIAVFSKLDDASYDLLRDPFSSDMLITHIAYGDNSIYYLDDSSGTSITKVSLDTFQCEELFSQDPQAVYSYLGLSFKDNIILESSIHSFFTDGNAIYPITYNGEIYQIKNGKAECIIPDGNQLNMVAFDGKTIYYINHSLELMAYNVVDKQSERLAGGFVKSLYYDGSRLLYSNKNGIYSMDIKNGATELLTEMTAEQISSDGSRIVFYADETLYLLDHEIRTLMRQKLLHFSILSNTDMVYYVYYYNGENVSDVLEI